MCRRVLEEILPPLQSQYNDQLRVELVKVISLDDIDRLYQLGST
jgi:hypothetical protein